MLRMITTNLMVESYLSSGQLQRYIIIMRLQNSIGISTCDCKKSLFHCFDSKLLELGCAFSQSSFSFLKVMIIMFT